METVVGTYTGALPPRAEHGHACHSTLTFGCINLRPGNLDLERSSCTRWNACMVTNGLFRCLPLRGWLRAGWLCLGTADGRDLMSGLALEYTTTFAVAMACATACCLSLRCAWNWCERGAVRDDDRRLRERLDEGLPLTSSSQCGPPAF